MSGSNAKAQVAELLASSVEATIAKGLNEDFPDDDDWVSILPLNLDTLQAICFMNIPNARIERSDEALSFTEHGVEQVLCLTCERNDSSGSGDSTYHINLVVTQCDSYIKAIKAMRGEIKRAYQDYGPLKRNKLGNYALGSTDGSELIWVRYTTVVKLRVEDDDYGQ